MLLLAHLEKLGQEQAVNSDEYGINKQPGIYPQNNGGNAFVLRCKCFLTVLLERAYPSL
jgi:hypothetical protein